MKPYPIIIIDDDRDDIDLMKQALEDIKFCGEVIIFDDSVKALEYLVNITVQPLVILCDVNMHQMDGLSLRQALFANESHRMKTIPFLFLSTSSAPPHILHAYELCAQGYFIKPNSFEDLTRLLASIINYWQRCSHPHALA